MILIHQYKTRMYKFLTLTGDWRKEYSSFKTVCVIIPEAMVMLRGYCGKHTIHDSLILYYIFIKKYFPMILLYMMKRICERNSLQNYSAGNWWIYKTHSFQLTLHAYDLVIFNKFNKNSIYTSSVNFSLFCIIYWWTIFVMLKLSHSPQLNVI